MLAGREWGEVMQWWWRWHKWCGDGGRREREWWRGKRRGVRRCDYGSQVSKLHLLDALWNVCQLQLPCSWHTNASQRILVSQQLIQSMLHWYITMTQCKCVCISLQGTKTHIGPNRGDNTYHGCWHFDEVNEWFDGNPVWSAAIKDMHDACKNKDGEGDRTHAWAMTFNDMEKLLTYTMHHGLNDNELGDLVALGLGAMTLLFNTFVTTGFNLWTQYVNGISLRQHIRLMQHISSRNCETVWLQAKHFNFSPDPLPNRTPATAQYIRISLKNQKNWQRKMKKGKHGLNSEWTTDIVAQS